jgi:hypothetical protein
VKPSVAFGVRWSRTGVDYYHTICAECRRSRSRKYYESRKKKGIVHWGTEESRRYQREDYQKNRIKVLEDARNKRDAKNPLAKIERALNLARKATKLRGIRANAQIFLRT